MLKLLVLGGGCAKCELLEKRTREAAEALGLEYELNKVKDLGQIASFGVMITPALVVNGVVRLTGKVPTVEEIKKLLA
jgi:small redox-active disulfide protein 2